MTFVPSQRRFLRTPDPPHVLPLKAADARHGSRYFPRRCTRLLFFFILSFAAFFCLFLYRLHLHFASYGDDDDADHPLPPLYEAYHEYERHLPQHDLSLPFPEGRDAKFFWAPNHVTESGWGNVMQELIFNAMLAHDTNRAFVFDNYTWSRGDAEYAEFNGKLIPARIPLSAIISGPIIGSSFRPGDPSPRAVHKDYFKRVCPNPTILDSNEVVSAQIRYDDNVPASQIFNKWVEKLNSINDPCVEIQSDSPQLFDIWVFGSARVLSIWPRLSKSPLLQDFSWSPLILEAFARNSHLFGVNRKSFQYLPSYLRLSSRLSSKELHNVDPILPASKIDPIPGLLVLHIRRGDFSDHCVHLAKWASSFNGFNKYAVLPDKFHPPSDAGGGETTEANRLLYLERCFPSPEQIAKKVREVLADQKKVYGGMKELKRVYVMTNGDKAFVDDLKEALGRVKRWDSVTTSRDLRLRWEAKPVAQAMDMLVGQRAQVFIGNGFSSLTSNVVMLRMLRELPPEDTRFW